MNFLNKDYGTIFSTSLVRSSNDTQSRSWSINYYSQSSISAFQMTGLAVINNYVCVSGFIFYFSDNTSKLVGSRYSGTQTQMLSLNNTNVRKLVNSYVDDVIYSIQISNLFDSCVIGGDQSVIRNNYIDTSYYTIMNFWGSDGLPNGEYACLKVFGIDYYLL